MKNKRYMVVVLGLTILTLTGCGNYTGSEDTHTEEIQEEEAPSKEYAGTFYTFDKEELLLDANFSISDCYITNEVIIDNHYYIDDENVLWGNGWNSHGQLGNELTEEYYEEYMKIAEDVVHVDSSQGGQALIYLTKDGNLYINGSNLNGVLMERVKYARIGGAGIIALLENGDVYWWERACVGETDIDEVDLDDTITRYKEPILIMEDARYVTCEDDNAAVITNANELYIWGNNKWGQCGSLTEEEYITEPVKVLDDVRMVWIHFLKFNSPKGQEHALDEVYKYEYYYNTFVLLENGEFAACGKDIGQYERTEEVFEEFEDPGKKEIIRYSPDFLYVEIKEDK